MRDLTGLNISAVVRNRQVMKRLADVFKIISTAYPETLSKLAFIGFIGLFWALFAGEEHEKHATRGDSYRRRPCDSSKLGVK